MRARSRLPMLLLEILEDVAKLAFSVAALYVGLRLVLRHRRRAWHDRIDQRRAAFLWLLVLGAVAVMVAEDALGGDSHLIDRHLLLFIREHVPTALAPPFQWITLTASGHVLTPLTIATCAALLFTQRRGDAMLVAASMACSGVLIYVLKTLVGRERPALWPSEWYWGSSFPSGHTLAMASFATATALVAGRSWPALRVPALVLALAWVLLVGFSRLVLGVHWPTDVVVAACIGAAIPLGFSFSLEQRRN
jgi:undecaprenyl-diphosphatase